MKESRFDSRHGEGNRFNGVIQDSKCPRELDGLDVADVLGKKSQALMKTVWSVWREREKMWSILGNFKRLYRTVTLELTKIVITYLITKYAELSLSTNEENQYLINSIC